MDQNPKVNVNVTVPEELLRKFVNLSGHKKTMECKKRQRYTTHVSISNSEGEDDALGKIIMAINDYNPLVTLSQGNRFACTECGRVRFEGGLFSGFM